MARMTKAQMEVARSRVGQIARKRINEVKNIAEKAVSKLQKPLEKRFCLTRAVVENDMAVKEQELLEEIERNACFFMIEPSRGYYHRASGLELCGNIMELIGTIDPLKKNKDRIAAFEALNHAQTKLLAKGGFCPLTAKEEKDRTRLLQKINKLCIKKEDVEAIKQINAIVLKAAEDVAAIIKSANDCVDEIALMGTGVDVCLAINDFDAGIYKGMETKLN